ncbi:MAG: UDP-N-acetylmuramate dehydrogenase [Deltaproteobacteria bacterium]|nr:MAG: UDP-N-acetylmuramate dehydrogenase [Deltaproteobacteria bacterium]
MPASRSLLADLQRLGLSPIPDEPLARRGFWRIGGPADVWVEVSDEDQLRGVMALGVPVTVVGRGSNLLVADAGIRGITVRLGGALRSGRIGPAEADLGAGMANTVLLARLRSAGLGGAAALAGVPGTLGGAVRMNAGWSLGEIGQRVLSVRVVRPGGDVEELPARALDFAYRQARLPPGAVVTRVRLSLLTDPEAVAAEHARVDAHLARRRRTQPLDQPSCGSVFKNPPGDAAGRLLEDAGLKGTARGGARISDKHANFIVNTGGATAADVWWLVRHARDTVWRRFGVMLEPEVHPAGDWPAGHWPLPPPE